MAELRAGTLNRRDKILPSLLDRLLSTPYSPEGGVFVSPDRYLESVRRDLYWLLKTEVTRMDEVWLTPSGSADVRGTSPGGRTLAEFPQASCSVLAFGVPAQRGTQGLQSTGGELARAIKIAIQRFEPRIDPASVRVTASAVTTDQPEEMARGLLEFNIRGLVRMKPVSEELMLKAIYQPALAQWRIEGVASES